MTVRGRDLGEAVSGMGGLGSDAVPSETLKVGIASAMRLAELAAGSREGAVDAETGGDMAGHVGQAPSAKGIGGGRMRSHATKVRRGERNVKGRNWVKLISGYPLDK